jgi:hypothetical protein
VKRRSRIVGKKHAFLCAEKIIPVKIGKEIRAAVMSSFVIRVEYIGAESPSMESETKESV